MDKPRILAIDDEISFTDFLTQFFEPRGYAIDVASDGNKGLELVKNNDYDVALLDLKMSGVSGDDIMREIQELGKKIQIIFITAFNDSGKTRERLLGEGAFAFVEKPITSLKALEELINRAANENE